jgi:hypothetical protein
LSKPGNMLAHFLNTFRSSFLLNILKSVLVAFDLGLKHNKFNKSGGIRYKQSLISNVGLEIVYPNIFENISLIASLG